MQGVFGFKLKDCFFFWRSYKYLAYRRLMMIRKHRRLNESSGGVMSATWELDGTLTSDIEYKDWVVLRTISGKDGDYEVNIQALVEKDFTGSRLKDPYLMSLMNNPRRFSRLNDAIEFAETRCRSYIDRYIAGVDEEEE